MHRGLREWRIAVWSSKISRAFSSEVDRCAGSREENALKQKL
jgi:hypothetical protein